MFRTTPELMRGIIETDEEFSDEFLESFILPANELVTEICVPAEYTDERLELIERWLSAHFYAVLDPRARRETAGAVAAEYQSKVDLGLNVTHYGQMAMRLDTAGGLAKLDKETLEGGKRTVGITHLGKRRSELWGYRGE